jgi:hypothetical protein
MLLNNFLIISILQMLYKKGFQWLDWNILLLMGITSSIVLILVRCLILQTTALLKNQQVFREVNSQRGYMKCLCRKRGFSTWYSILLILDRSIHSRLLQYQTHHSCLTSHRILKEIKFKRKSL